MKIDYKYKILLPLFVLLLASCNDFLDVKPKGVVTPTTVDDYYALLSSPLEMTRMSSNQLYFSDDIYLPEQFRASANSYPNGKASVRAYDFEDYLYDSNEEDPDWTIAYRTIYICNTILTGLETNTEPASSKKNIVKGEALVHRAYTYLTLVNEYANNYCSTSSTDLGVPMPLKPDINAQLARSTVKEVYDQIEKDLLESIAYLPDNSDYSYRPKKASAYGVLARMYLFMGNWEKAYEYSNMAYKTDNYIYDFNTYSWANPSNHAASVINGYPSSSTGKKDIVLHKYLRSVMSYFFVFLFSTDLVNQYDNGDLRFEFGSSPSDYSLIVLPNPGILDTKAVYDYNHAGITSAELLLIRAEALARLSKTQEAINDLNSLRKKRIKTSDYKDLTATTPSKALDLVLKERRVELAFGGMRLFDIKRLNVDGRNISIKHGNNILAPGDPKFVLPIPSKVISLNPNIKQNPR